MLRISPQKVTLPRAVQRFSWYVISCNAKGKPIAEAEEIPVECGVMVFSEGRFEVLRSAPKRPAPQLPFAVWMALAKATTVQALGG